MSKLTASLRSMNRFDDLALMNSPIHRLHPVAKLVTTLVFLIVTTSFDRYALTSLLPLFLYPVLIIIVADLPAGLLLKRLLLLEPLILGIGLLNPLFDRVPVQVGTIYLTGGWVTFLNLTLKGSLAALAALLLLATTGLDRLAAALRSLGVPRIMVTQIYLTWRYLTVLGQEVARTQRAYTLRAPNQRGIHIRAWGSLLGQLLLRTFDRAERIYQAMALRGFSGEYPTGSAKAWAAADTGFILFCLLYLIVVRLIDPAQLLGAWLAGGIS